MKHVSCRFGIYNLGFYMLYKRLYNDHSPLKHGYIRNFKNSRVLKELATTIAPILAVIFQASYATGEVPSLWKTTNICPVYKKGKKFDPINYRPISLTCIPCKLVEHIVTSHIMIHASNFDILNPFQHGFRRGISCL